MLLVFSSTACLMSIW